MAHAAGLPVVPHSANLSLVTVFKLHMMGAIENAGPYVEFSIEPNSYYPWQEGLFDPVLKMCKTAKCRYPTPRPGAWKSSPDWLNRADRVRSASMA